MYSNSLLNAFVRRYNTNIAASAAARRAPNDAPTPAPTAAIFPLPVLQVSVELGVPGATEGDVELVDVELVAPLTKILVIGIPTGGVRVWIRL